jgi:hypothetical protein
MDFSSTYNATLQMIAAFLIFIVAYLALFFLIIISLVTWEALHQGISFAWLSLTQSETLTLRKPVSLKHFHF